MAPSRRHASGRWWLPHAAAVIVGAAAVGVAAAGAAAPVEYDTWLKAWRAGEAGSLIPTSNGGRGPLGLHWMAPLLSGGGYCSEAMAYLMALVGGSGVTVSAEQHGDSVNSQYLHGLPPLEHQVLGTLLARTPSMSRTIVVCHSEPGAWHLPAHPQRYMTSICPPAAAAFRVGRTMFETDRLPSGWAARLNAMDEVWVPSSFARDVFAAGGVERGKLVVVPEAVDTSFFDPAAVPNPPMNAHIKPRVACALPPDADAPPPPINYDDYEDDDGEGEYEEEEVAPPQTAAAGALLRGASPLCPVRFLSVGKWERRKNYAALLRAFLTTFARRADTPAEAAPPYAELYILTSAYHSSGDFEAAIATMVATTLACPDPDADATSVGVGVDGRPVPQPRDDTPVTPQPCVPRNLTAAGWTLPPVRLLRDIPQTDMPLIYASVDAFVSPTRGEGWGRPHVEAMAMGLPVLATNWSGITEFLTPDVGYPIPYTHLAPIPDGAFAGHLQAEVDVPALAVAMRHVARNPAAAAAKGAAARAAMVARYQPATLAAFLAHQVTRITALVHSRELFAREAAQHEALAAARAGPGAM